MALAVDGSVWCWGAADAGQIGNGQGTAPVRVPKRPALPAGAVANDIAAGSSHVLVIVGGTKLYAWGSNSHGQLGDGSVVTRRSPVLISTQPDGIAKVVAGIKHSLALLKRYLAF